jgi:DNA-binding HxlR family transcriptional regulator
MAPAVALTFTPDLDLTRDALASSTLNHGLMVLGDRWTVAVLLGAFTGAHRFEEWQTRLGIPRPTLASRLRSLVGLGLLRRRAYQQRPERFGYHLTSAGLKLYDHVLMSWLWEKRWGTRRTTLPPRLLHHGCGHHFVPVLACSACGDKAGMGDLQLRLQVNSLLLARAGRPGRTARVASTDATSMGLGLRVDRWSLLIVSAVLLGCHYFDQLLHVLGISSSVLARRLGSMVETGLLLCQPDQDDARRNVYRLTAASRDLFGYLVCFSTWASREQLHQPSSIRPTHKACGKAFVPQVVCSACRQRLRPWDVSYDPPPASQPPTAKEKTP